MHALLTPFRFHSFSRTRSCGSKIQAFIDHAMIPSYKRTHSSSLYWWCFHYQSSSTLRKINEHTIAEAGGSMEHTRNPSAESWESWVGKKVFRVYTVRCAMGKVTNAKASHVRNYNDLKCEYACMIFKISCSTTILSIVNAVFRRNNNVETNKKNRWISHSQLVGFRVVVVVVATAALTRRWKWCHYLDSRESFSSSLR